MTLPPANTPDSAVLQPPKWKRMMRVWVLLAASMAAAVLLCRAAMPSGDASEEPGAGSPTDAAALERVIWPKTMLPERPWRYLVIHHSATPGATLEAIDKAHRDRNFENGAGYHFLINNGRSAGTGDGEIVATPRWIEQLDGAHCHVPDHPEYNTEGIGICLVGNFDRHPPTAAQMTSLEILVLALSRRYEIPLDRIVGHGELKNTQCPGRLFPMEKFLMDLREASIDRQLLAPSETAAPTTKAREKRR